MCLHKLARAGDKNQKIENINRKPVVKYKSLWLKTSHNIPRWFLIQHFILDQKENYPKFIQPPNKTEANWWKVTKLGNWLSLVCRRKGKIAGEVEIYPPCINVYQCLHTAIQKSFKLPLFELFWHIFIY